MRPPSFSAFDAVPTETSAMRATSRSVAAAVGIAGDARGRVGLVHALAYFTAPLRKPET